MAIMNTVEEKKQIVPECGRRLSSIYFYLTQGCNLKCRHCWIAPAFQADGGKKAPFIEFELLKDIVGQGLELGLESVKLTGGEPLIHPDIFRIIDFIGESGLRLSIETNGVACSPEIAERIAGVPKRFVSISIDGADAATHEWVRGVEGSFEKTLQGVRNLVAAGIRPQIIMSLMRRNVRQIEEVLRLAQDLGANSVKFNPVIPTARGEQMHEQGESLGIKELVEIGARSEKEFKDKFKVGVFFTQPLAFRPLGKLFSGEGDCGKCGIFGIIGVLGSGRYALCGIGESIPELIFGDAKTDRLAEVWNKNTVLNEIREGIPSKLEGVCGECLMNSLCLGACVASNYYSSKNLFASYWFCEEARKAGLFPESRLKNKGKKDLT